MDLKSKKVFVGLSGGVDSAVTAAILKKQGASVVGVFIQGWYPPGFVCTWASDRRDAMRVAAALHIPFVTLDASASYKSSVIDYLLDEYRQGHTPNPDVMCNREVKFGAFYRYARMHGADYIATGHYAQLRHDADTHLLRGSDADKDQSYFLWAVPKEVLARTLFPLGAQHKMDTRTQAAAFTLPVANKKDSQGICFLGSISVDDFLRNEFGVHAGTIRTANGVELGTHDGAVLYTIGARIGSECALPGPWYVVQKDIATNTLVVARESVTPTIVNCIPLRDSNTLAVVPPNEVLLAQYRYHGPLVPGTWSEGGALFTPTTPLPEAVAAGQSLVLYRGDECVGGGIIS